MRVLVVDPRAPDLAVIDEAARVLRAGGLVAFPTETVYGLGARALDARAVARVFVAKGRPAGHPLIAHVADEDGARAISSSWDARASRLARAFWPGPLTLVVPRAAHVPAIVAGGADTLAVRAPSHAVARALLAAVGEPLAAPSANPYQTVSPTTAAHVVKGLGARVDLVLDGGPCDAGIESTVIDVCADPPRVLRPGALDVTRLRVELPDLIYAEEIVRGEGTRASPGMDARHYAPRARVFIAAHRAEALRDANARASAGSRVGLILCGGAPDAASLANGANEASVRVRALGDDPVQYAHDLFATLHELDDVGCDAIVVEAVPDEPPWFAVADRLRRAGAR